VTPKARDDGGIRLIAAVEAAKGLLVLAAGFGLLSLAHRDVQHAAERLLEHLHLNPAHRTPRIFLELAANATDARLMVLAALAAAYAALRLIEAYGLWRARRWAEWLAAGSGAIYVPFEIYGLLHGFSSLKASALLLNLAVVAYVSRALWRNRA
jgi:uncharacterized membrane protein (DUF2068 family)